MSVSKRNFILPFLIFFIITNSSFAQKIDIREIIVKLGNVARAYFLTANRPSFGVSTYTPEKNHLDINIGIVFNNEIFIVPASLGYGITDKLGVFTSADAYMTSFNFVGKRIDGFGDIILGMRYRFHESKYFAHTLEGAFKIPTASSRKELGTGFVDFHFGYGNAYSRKSFGYDLSVELNFLRRRKYPDENIERPIILQEAIDSIKAVYNYKYEPELIFTIGPSYNFSQKLSIYGGISLSRNFRLKFSTAQIYAGSGYAFSDQVVVGLGGSFGLLNSSPWLVSLDCNFTL